MRSDNIDYDNIFEWLVIFLSIIQATFFQYFTWEMTPGTEIVKKSVVGWMILLTLPLIVSILSWIYSNFREKIQHRLKIKIFSWSIVCTALLVDLLLVLSILFDFIFDLGELLSTFGLNISFYTLYLLIFF